MPQIRHPALLLAVLALSACGGERQAAADANAAGASAAQAVDNGIAAPADAPAETASEVNAADSDDAALLGMTNAR